MSQRVCSRHLSKRLRETLDGLLGGGSAKEIAADLGLSPHTVQNYIKAVYREYNVNSRGELLALFIAAPALDTAMSGEAVQ